MIGFVNRNCPRSAFFFATLFLLSTWCCTVGEAQEVNSPVKKPISVDFTKLLDPQIGEKLKLTDDQRSSISTLLNERSEALAEGELQLRPQITAEYNQKLTDVLTKDQQAIWQTTFSEPRLQFKFRFQRWVDVLEWFADQAGLSLVLDAPPPGTFNYTDRREYTPVEAIDLLNGVLLTKGFTLIRRDRMLFLVELSEEIPANMIPRIKLEDLDKHGRYELVSVMFPLGNRNAEEVDSEFKPLLGPYGKSVPLPKTKQVLVTDTAGIMRAISAVIESIPEPKPPTKPQPKPKPPAKPKEKPILKVYPLRSLSPQAVLEVFKALMPNTRVVHDPQSNQLNAYATPTDQKGVAAVLEQMSAKAPADQKPRFDIYELEHNDPVQLLETLKPLVPAARLTYDAEKKRLVAWGTPQDHETLKVSIKGLGIDEQARPARRVEVYPLSETDPSSVLSWLQPLVPRALLTVDNQTQKLIAVASVTDQETIRTTLEQLQKKKSPEELTRFQFYSLKQAIPSDILNILKSLAPKAQITANSDSTQLSALAVEADHEIIKNILTQMEEARNAQPQPELKFYAVTASERQRFQTVLSTLSAELPGIRTINDSEPGKLSIWAKPEQHSAIVKLLEQIRSDASDQEKHKLTVYPIHSSNPTNLLTLLNKLHPDMQILHDTEEKRLLVWTSPDGHDALKISLQQLDSDQSLISKKQVQVYPINGADPAVVLSTLSQLIPQATFTQDTQAKTIVAFAKPVEQQVIKQTIEQLQSGTNLQQKPQLKIYPVTTAQRKRFQAVLGTLSAELPNIQVITDAEPGELAIWALPTEHRTIGEIITQLSQETPQDKKHKLVVYPVRVADPEGVLSAFEKTFPDTEFVLEKKSRRLLAWSSPELHDQIQATLTQIDTGERISTQEIVQAYPTGNVSASTVENVLERLLPDVEFTSDRRAELITAVATAEEHQLIKRTIEQMAQAGSEQNDRQIVSYPFSDNDPDAAISLLNRLFRDARFVNDEKAEAIVATATKGDHRAISQAIEKIQGSSSGQSQEQLLAYPFPAGNINTTLEMLKELAPRATLISDDKARTIVARAKPSDHVIIAKAIDQMKAAAAAEHKSVLKVYPLTTAQRRRFDAVRSTITGDMPNLRIITDAEPGELSIWATEAEHQVIGEVIQQLQRDIPENEKSQLIAYPITSADLQSTNTILKQLYPRVQIVVDEKTQRLLIWAKPDEHLAVKTSLAQIDSEISPEARTEFKVVPLNGLTSSVVLSVLQQLLPQVTFNVDTSSGALVAWGRKSDLDKIDPTITRMRNEADASSGRILTIYDLESTGAANAVQILQPIIPDSSLVVSADPNKLMAWADPEDHKKLKAAVEQMENQEKTSKDQVLAVYPLQSNDAESLLEMLDEKLMKNVKTVTDSKRKILLVWADASRHEAIKKAIKQFQTQLPPVPEKTSQVYHFKNNNPETVLPILSSLVPDAEFVVNSANQSLVAGAMPQEHKKINEIITQIDQPDENQSTGKLRTYEILASDPNSFLSVLESIFENKAEVKLSLDASSEKLIAFATAKDHEKIQSLIKDMESQADSNSQAQLVVYPLKSADPSAVEQALNALLKNQKPLVQMSVEPRSRQMIVVARAHQHALIKTTIEQLQEESRELEVIQLEVIDPFTAQMAIERLFGFDAGEGGGNVPIVDSDDATQKLFIRANVKQLAEIRQLLVKMGETNLSATTNAANRRLRVIPFQGDVQSALREIQKVWPQLRTNPIKMVTPSAVIPSLRNFAPIKSPQESIKSSDTDKLKERESADASDENKKKIDNQTTKSPDSQEEETFPVAFTTSSNEKTTQEKQPDAEDSTNKTLPNDPIIIAPGNGSITIASDDSEALDQLESLLRALSSRRETGSRDFAVFSLKNTSASIVSEALKRLFPPNSLGLRGGNVIAVPDQRLNAVIVHANRADQATIENLLKILDSPDVPESFIVNQPTLIPIKNSKATRMEEVLREIYKTQLTSGGGRPAIPVPSGASSEISSLIQQINAASSGPMMTLGVDEITNSLILMAPKTLAEEVTQLIEKLDRAAEEDSSRVVRFVPLKKLNAEQMQESLESIIREALRRSSR